MTAAPWSPPPALALLAPPGAGWQPAAAREQPAVTVYAAGDLARWRAELARDPARCTLAYWHHPLYSSGMHGNMTRMKKAWQLLYEAGAELVLSDHDYERFAPRTPTAIATRRGAATTTACPS